MTTIQDTWRETFDRNLPSDPHVYTTTGDSAQQGFTVGRVNEAYVVMFEATGDRVYLDKAARNFDATITTARANTFNGTTPVLTSPRYTTDKKPYPFLVHDGHVLFPMVRFVSVVRANQPALADLLPKAESYFAFARDHYVKRWDAEYRPLASMGGTFVMPTWMKTVYSGIPAGRSLAYNMSNAFAMFLWRYSRLDPGALGVAAAQKAMAVARTFKRALKPMSGGAVTWPYADYLVSADSASRYRGMPGGSLAATDTAHANTDVQFVNELCVAQPGVVFLPADLVAIATGFKTIIHKTGTMRTYVNGYGASTSEQIYGYSTLARIDPAIAPIMRVLNAKYFSRLAVAHLALYDGPDGKAR